MPSPVCTRTACNRPVQDAFLCDDCTRTVRADLRSLGISPNLLAELEVTMARLDVVDPVHRPATVTDEPLQHLHSDEPIAAHKLPFHTGAADVLDTARAALSTWVRHLVETRYGAELDGLTRDAAYRACAGTGAHGPWRPGPQLPDNTLSSMAAWLGRHTESIRADPGGGELAEDVARVVTQAWRVVQPQELEYLAFCEVCAAAEPPAAIDLYVPRGARVGACPRCRTSFDVVERRDTLMEHARDYLLTATEASRALVDWVRTRDPDNPLTASAIRGLAKRGQVSQRPPAAGQGAARYRLGELMDVVERRTTGRATQH